MNGTIPTGHIPGSACPRCDRTLMVINKKNFMYLDHNPQFVGCTGYPQCGYVRTVTTRDAEIMAEVQRERDAMPAEF